MNKLIRILIIVLILIGITGKINSVFAYTCTRCSDTYWGTMATWEEDDPVCDRDGYETPGYSCASCCRVTCGTQDNCSGVYSHVNVGCGNYSNCSEVTCSHCSGSLSYNASRTTYQSSSPSCGSACTSGTVTCGLQGITSGTGNSYCNTSCTAKCCASGGCSETSAGGTCTSYSNSSPSCGNPCTDYDKVTTCQTSGSWSSTPYSYSGCTTTCCIPWGGTKTVGQTITAYQNSSVPCGSSCVSQTRTCQSTGLFNNSYTNQSCSVTGCSSCSSAACGTVVHGGTCTTYSNTSPSCGTSCSSVSRTSTCNDGSWDLAPYANSSCTACCNLPWGGTISGGQSVTAYSASSTSCPNLCSDIDETRTCNSTTGVLNGSYQYQSCDTGTCASCNLPWGGTINHGQSVTAYSSTSVSCNSSCSSQLRTCSNGTLSGDSQYQYQSCEPDCPCSFPFSGNKTITESCGFGATSGRVDGVEAGTGVSNTGVLTIDGATITIGGANNQILGFGQINLINGGSIIIAKGVGAQFKKGPIWIQDGDQDGYISSNATFQVDTGQPSGYTRRGSTQNAASGLVEYWTMDQTASPCTNSISSNNATWTNDPTSTTGKYGNAINYDGSNDYLATSLSLNLGQPFTWSAWVNINSSSSVNRFFGQGNVGSGGTGFAVAAANSTNKIRVYYPNNSYQDSADSITTGSWYHIAITRAENGTNNIKVYINGVYSALSNETASPSDTSSYFEVGRLISSTAQYSGTNKKIDEVRIYNRALSAGEVYNLYKHDPTSNYFFTDCNDSDINKWVNRPGYVDSDGDTYGSGNSQDVCSGSNLATGYSTNNTDCNDASTYVYQNIASTAPDVDQDGYASSSSGTNCVGSSTNVSGRTYYKNTSNQYAYVLSPLGTSDCDVNDVSKWQSATLYTDSDSDGYGTGGGSVICYGSSPPSNYAANNTDCNDSDNDVYQTVSVAPDFDQDNYATASASSTCVGSSSTINTKTYYKNTVGDYVYVASPTGTSDCSDTDSRANPGSVQYFSSPITGKIPAGGAYDFNCSGAEESDRGGYNCIVTSTTSCMTTKPGTTADFGYSGSYPGCGQTGTVYRITTYSDSSCTSSTGSNSSCTTAPTTGGSYKRNTYVLNNLVKCR